MNRGLLPGLVGLFVTVGLAHSVHAQEPSLADVARQEQARRAGITDKSKVYTNADLNGGGLTIGAPRAAPTETGSQERGAPSSPDSTETAAAPESQEAEQGEDYWRGRLTAAQDARRRTEVLAAAFQNRVDMLQGDWNAWDDPVQREEIYQNRIAALQALENADAEMVRLDQEIRDIREEARRADVPPGWLR